MTTPTEANATIADRQMTTEKMVRRLAGVILSHHGF